MSHSIGLLIESLVALLLLVTIGYCALLNRRLQRLKADERALAAVVAELAGATDRAERAIVALKATVKESEQALGERLHLAERLSHALAEQIESAHALLGGVSGVNGVAAALQGPQTPRPPDAKAVVAAAQAFAERTRARLYGRAA